MSIKLLIIGQFMLIRAISTFAADRDTLWCQSIDEAMTDPKKVYGLRLTGHQEPSKLAWLNKLTTLEILEFGGCDLTQLPEEIGALTTLRILRINFNKSLQRIPESISNLQNLQLLEISGNNILKNLPESITHLTSLDAFTVQFNDSLRRLPNDLGNLPALRELKIWHNISLDSLPQSLGALQKMERCTLDGVNNYFIPQSLSFCKSLRLLYIRCIWGKPLVIPANIGELVNLDSLQLEGNLGSIPEGISSLKITYLELRWTNYSEFPEQLCALSSIHTLKLYYNMRLNGFKPPISKMQNISALSLNGNPNFKLSTLELLKECTSLRRLDLSESSITRLPKAIATLNNVRAVALCNLRPARGKINWTQLISVLSKMQELSFIDFSGNTFSSLPKSLNHLHQVDTLYFNSCRGKGLSDVSALSKGIQVLRMRSCRLTQCPVNVEKIQSLQCLDLGGNQIIAIEDRITELKNLKSLYVNDQRKPMGDGPDKSGEDDCTLEKISSRISEMKGLATLDLRGNEKIRNQVDDLRKSLPGCDVMYN